MFSFFTCHGIRCGPCGGSDGKHSSLRILWAEVLMLITFLCANLQETSKRLFPGWEDMWWKNCVILPAEGKQNATFSADFTKPGKRLLELPCTSPLPLLPEQRMSDTTGKSLRIDGVVAGSISDQGRSKNALIQRTTYSNRVRHMSGFTPS